MSVIVWSRPVKSKPYSNVFQSTEDELLAKAQAVHPLLCLLDDFVCVGSWEVLDPRNLKVLTAHTMMLSKYFLPLWQRLRL